MDKKVIHETRPLLPQPVEFFEKIKEIFASGFLTNHGEQVQELERRLEEFLGVKNVLVFCNGTLALQLALQALDLKGEVITTPFTFPATVHAIVYNNLTPVFCDIEPKFFNLDSNKIEPLITEKTSAILPVHVFGKPCRAGEIQEIAKKYNLKVIYDAAHAFGVRIKKIPIGSFGDISMFSFHATKKFNTLEGGALAFSDDSLRERLELLRNFGIKGEEEIICVGTNAKMNEIQAAFGLLLLDNIRADTEKRKGLAGLYTSLLSNSRTIRLPVSVPIKSNAVYYVILVKEGKRDKVCERLRSKGIMARKRFYPLCSQYPCYSHLPSSKNLPVAERISEQVLSLPLHNDLTEGDIARIVGIIIEEVG